MHETGKNKKGGGICLYIFKSLKFNVRDDIDLFNESVETLSIEMSNKAAFLLADFNLNASEYDTNKVVKNFFNLVFQNGFLPLIQRLMSQ